jgi:hypothetical protein
MNRRQFVLAMPGAVALLACSTRPGGAECGSSGITEFIDITWQKQARLLAARMPPDNEQFENLFSPGMRVLMHAPRPFLRDQPIGPLLNAFFGWGVLPGAEIKVGNIEIDSGDQMGPATVRVKIEHRSEPHQILVHVIMVDDDWRIANIIYDNGKSLIDHYRAITGRRG